MNWAAISSVSDLVAALAVVVSLLYVAIQLRQNTKAIEASSRQGLLDGDLGLISEYMSHAVDPHLIGDEVKLSAENERRFFWLVVKALRIREFASHQYNSGILDESTWRSYMAPVPGIFSTKRARSVLDIYTGSPKFMQVIRAHVTDATT
ncbi:hypothetical protein [Altererythrobacter sp. Root672]|uniref:hypothetical protein n=1 Tax=Altererythrobacter sp. Root672 TaxID=1736584 RepID=UPI0006F3EC63|nr:hypothetical protein [Altererythrobacter sp. Root672]KRA83770.1 hypothetical protein ASD76_07060 [Altererythrobacter sp. Root672]